MSAAERSRARVAGGLGLEYAERGRGPAVLFLHGYTDSWLSFDPVVRRLPGDVRALALTQRGHGDSDRPASGYRVEDFATDVVRFMDATGVPQAALVGHSMGSLVAQAVAVAHPDRVSRLVLVGSATSFDSPVARELERAVGELRDPIPRAFVAEFQASTVHRPIPEAVFAALVDESLKMPARIWREVMAGILAYRADARLARITVPTLLVWGDRDALSPRAEQERLRATIPGATLAVYEATGHAPHWEEPERFVHDLVAFLSPAPRAAMAASGSPTPS